MSRLDEVVGGDWSDAYQKAPSGGLECALTVCGVTRRDVGDDDSDNEKEKAGYSDAFKRAAVKFGVGRFLYSLPKMYAQVKQIGKNFYLADGEEKRLQGMITAALSGKPQPEQRKPVSAPVREVVETVVGYVSKENWDAHAKRISDDADQSKKPAAQEAKPTDEHKKLIAEWSASFNAIPLPLRGQAYTLKTPSQATDDEIRKAITHNKQLASPATSAPEVVQPDELKIFKGGE
jgi:hypothetical protein